MMFGESYKKLILAILLVTIFIFNKNIIAGGSSSQQSASSALSSLDPRETRELREYMEEMLRYRRPTSNASQQSELWRSFKDGVDRGISRTGANFAESIFTLPIKYFPTLIGGSTSLLGIYLYKLAFGSLGLSWNGLAKMNNRVYTLCKPFTFVPAGNTVKKQRLKNLEGQLDDLKEIPASILNENNWTAYQEALIQELEHTVNFLKRTANSYNKSYMTESYFSLKFQLGRIVHAFSSHDNDEVCFYIERTISYLEKIIELLKNIGSFEEIESKVDQFKRWLMLTNTAFEHVALMLVGDNGLKPSNGLSFQKLNAESSSSSSASSVLDTILGGSSMPTM